MSISIEPSTLHSPAAQALIRELNAELSAMYPEPGANHFRLDPDEVSAGRGAFVIALDDGTPIGCGAVRRIDESTGEIKRMYVRPDCRGRGVARAVLDQLEAEARRLGLGRIVLETGTRQLAAIALYERSGFARIPPFGEYVASAATSVCMAKDLA